MATSTKKEFSFGKSFAEMKNSELDAARAEIDEEILRLKALKRQTDEVVAARAQGTATAPPEEEPKKKVKSE